MTDISYQFVYSVFFLPCIPRINEHKNAVNFRNIYNFI